MPGAVPLTASRAFASASYPYVSRLAALGLEQAAEDSALALGVNTYQGHITCPCVANALEQKVVSLEKLLGKAT